MSRTRHRLVSRTLAVLLTAGALTVPAAAHAERWSAADPRHDVRSVSPDATRCAPLDPRATPRNRTTDLTRLAVDHAADAVRFTTHLRDVRPRGRVMLGLLVRTPERSYLVMTYRYKGSPWPHVETEALVTRVPRSFGSPCHRGSNPGSGSGARSGPSTGRPRPAAGAECSALPVRYRPGRDTVSTVVPRECLGTPRWVRVGGYAVDMVGKRIVLDTWAPEGVADKSLIGGVLGPRVHAGARALLGGAR